MQIVSTNPNVRFNHVGHRSASSIAKATWIAKAGNWNGDGVQNWSKARGLLLLSRGAGAQTLNKASRRFPPASATSIRGRPDAAANTQRHGRHLRGAHGDRGRAVVTLKRGSGISPTRIGFLVPGPLGAYTLHKLEIPNYVTCR